MFIGRKIRTDILLWIPVWFLTAGSIFEENRKSGSFELIAHRGGSFSAPENTLAAVSNAIEKGVSTIEVDVRQTLDSVVVVIHDGSVNRTTDGRGAVNRILFDDLRRLNAGLWFHHSFSQERIPTLEEVLLLVNGSARLIVDVKGDSSKYPGIEQRVVSQIQKAGAVSWCAVQSMYDQALRRVHRIDSTMSLIKVLVFDFPLIPLYVDHALRWGRLAPDLPLYAVQIHWFSISAGLVRNLHDRGFQVWAWTVNNPKRIKKLIYKGVDGVTTDNPGILAEL